MTSQPGANFENSLYTFGRPEKRQRVERIIIIIKLSTPQHVAQSIGASNFETNIRAKSYHTS